MTSTDFEAGLSFTVNGEPVLFDSVAPALDPRNIEVCFANSFQYGDEVLMTYDAGAGDWASAGYPINSIVELDITNASRIGTPNSDYPLSSVVREPLDPRQGSVFAKVGIDLNFVDRELVSRYGPTYIDCGGTFGATTTNPKASSCLRTCASWSLAWRSRRSSWFQVGPTKPPLPPRNGSTPSPSESVSPSVFSAPRTASWFSVNAPHVLIMIDPIEIRPQSEAHSYKTVRWLNGSRKQVVLRIVDEHGTAVDLRKEPVTRPAKKPQFGYQTEVAPGTVSVNLLVLNEVVGTTCDLLFDVKGLLVADCEDCDDCTGLVEFEIDPQQEYCPGIYQAQIVRTVHGGYLVDAYPVYFSIEPSLAGSRRTPRA